jgi:hypothetical protein
LLFHSRALPAENITSSRPVIQKEEKKLAVLASRPPLESQFIALAPITVTTMKAKIRSHAATSKPIVPLES